MNETQLRNNDALSALERVIRAAFIFAYDDERSDGAVKLYFYSFAGIFFADEEWKELVEVDDTTVRKEKVNWIVLEGGRRLAEWIKTLKLDPDKHLTFIVYGVECGGRNSTDWFYNIDGEGNLNGVGRNEKWDDIYFE